MLKSKVWWGDDHPSQAAGVIGTDAITFRITDSKPRIQPPPPSRTRKPTCHGDPDVCKELVGTAAVETVNLSRSRPALTFRDGASAVPIGADFSR